MMMSKTNEIMIPYQSDEVCPLCQNNRYLNPNMVLLLSECFHKMCQSCVDSTFKNGNAKCHVCNTTLKKADFEPQMFQDFEVEKEIRIRKKLAKIFNKRRDNFPDLKSYNDYLEMVEEYVMNILEGIDVEQTWATVRKYAEENKELIRMNEIKEADENKNYKRLLDDQKRQRDEGLQESLRLIKEAEETKRKAESEIISNLANSTKSASEIINEQNRIKRKNRELSAAELKNKAMKSRYDPRFDMNKHDEEDEGHYIAFEPIYNPIDIELKKRYRDRICYPALNGKEKLAAGGGYSVEYAYLRAIEAAHMAVSVDLPFKNE